MYNRERSKVVTIFVSYLAEGAHEKQNVFKETEGGRAIQGWNEFKNKIFGRVDVLNYKTVSRVKLAKMEATEGICFFQWLLPEISLYIPKISIEEQIDRQTRGMESYIQKELCKKNTFDLQTP